MSHQQLPPATAWQPITFSGVAAFAQAPLGRVFLMMLTVAVLGAISVVWFWTVAWVPAIQEAISRLPEEGSIRAGQLAWTSVSPVRLVERVHLGIVVDVDERHSSGQSSDVQCELGRIHWRLCSLAGCWRFSYPKGWTIPLNRLKLDAWWGAWRPVIAVGIGLSVVAGLWLSWTLMAWVYAVVVRLVAFFWHRQLSLSGAWRLAMAALMPGALWMSAAISLYGLRQMDLTGWLFAFGLHFVIGWIYLLGAPLRLPHRHSPGILPVNPFAAPSQPGPEGGAGQ